MQKRVLVVENNIQFSDDVCNELNKRDFNARSLFTKKTVRELNKALPNEQKFKARLLGALAEDIKTKGQIDIIVSNLQLIKDGVELISDGDYFGATILDYVYNNHPGICCVAWTAFMPENTAAFTDRYNLVTVINKKGSSPNVKAVCDQVVDVIDNGHPIKKKIQKRYYEINGVNSQIYRLLHINGVMSKVFGDIPDYDNRLIKALGGSLDESIGETIQLLADLWNSEPGLPRYPLINELGELEFGRAYWKEQRDHLHHMLLSYLCGLYLYYGCDLLRNALEKVMSESDFLLSWKIASLFHDLGYVFEVNYNEQGEINKEAFNKLNELYSNCLFHYSQARKGKVLIAEDTLLVDRAMIFIPKVIPRDINSLSKFGSEDLFLFINDEGRKAHLGELDDSIRRYWEFTQKNRTKGGRTYVDHGIASALILLQQYRSFHNYIGLASEAIRESKDALVRKETSDLLVSLEKKLPEYERGIELAAKAIALHNVNNTDWDHDHAFTEAKLTLNQYELSIKETPLAFFLALVDTFQSWDRHKYSMPLGPDYVLLGQELSIKFSKRKICFQYSSDDLSGTPQSIFKKTIYQISKYMNEMDLNELLEEIIQRKS